MKSIYQKQERVYDWVPDKPDPRDKMFKPKIAHIDVPVNIDLGSVAPPIRDQQNEGSCTGHGITRIFDTTFFKQHGIFLNPSPQFCYWLERVFEGDPKVDGGAQIRDGIKCLAKTGVCSEALWPYLITNMFTKPNKAAFAEAAKNKILTYESITGLTQAHQANAEGFSVVFGFEVYESFESVQTAKTGIVTMPKKNEKFLGGHCVVKEGKIGATKMNITANSWGTGWGLKGRFLMPDAYMASSMCSDFWAVKLVS